MICRFLSLLFFFFTGSIIIRREMGVASRDDGQTSLNWSRFCLVLSSFISCVCVCDDARHCARLSL